MSQQGGLKIIDGWRRKAFALSGSDVSMGSVLTKSLDFMNTVVKGGIGAPNMQFALESLKHERDLAMEFDENKDDPLRSVVYGVIESIGAMVNELAEQNKKALEQLSMKKVDEVPVFQETRKDGKSKETTAHPAYDTIVYPDTSNAQFVQPRDQTPFGDSAATTLFHAREMVAPKEEPMDQAPTASHGNVDSGTNFYNLPKFVENVVVHSVKDEEMASTSMDTFNSSQASIPLLSQIYQQPLTFPLHSASEDRSLHEEDEDDFEEYEETPNKSKANSSQQHKCHICSRKFAHETSLVKHKAACVAGKNRYACPDCPYTSARSVNLRRHRLSNHGASPFECSTCSERFEKLKHLQSHWSESGHPPEKTNEMLKRSIGL